SVCLQITFYEEQNFQGRHYECEGDCSEMHEHLARCNSIKVDSGCWMAYEKPDYMGYQYMLNKGENKGEYPDLQHWAAFNDRIRSCRMVPSYSGKYHIKLFEGSDFRGAAKELTEDCPDLTEHVPSRSVSSVEVSDGYWTLHEHSHYRGRQFFLQPGQYRRFHEWGSTQPYFGSIKRLTDLA
ncbi:crystallin, gamma MX, partial [Engraulis encrasicolus]|uniref:crystallin, gamma MX n=1 Tax=Engraulis encrasicolus TaxID=184585 RepID=UPI002FCF0FF3